MKKPSVIKSYNKLSDANLNTRAETIVNALTDNINFPTTTPPFAEFSAASTLYNTRLNAAVSSRSRLDIILKNDARESLLNIMFLLGINIESLSGQDLSKMATSGFVLSSQGGHAAPIDVPSNFRLKPGKNQGELIMAVKKAANAISYVFEYTMGAATADSKWISRGSSSKEYTFTNLPRGVEISCRVAAIGSRGQEVYSNVLNTMVL
jgi:hypothetical protein